MDDGMDGGVDEWWMNKLDDEMDGWVDGWINWMDDEMDGG